MKPLAGGTLLPESIPSGLDSFVSPLDWFLPLR